MKQSDYLVSEVPFTSIRNYISSENRSLTLCINNGPFITLKIFVSSTTHLRLMQTIKLIKIQPSMNLLIDFVAEICFTS